MLREKRAVPHPSRPRRLSSMSAVKVHLNQAQTWVPGRGEAYMCIYIYIYIYSKEEQGKEGKEGMGREGIQRERMGREGMGSDGMGREGRNE